MIAVLGGGFGLYGHLAALVGLNQPVATLRRYVPIIADRVELAPLHDRVRFFDEEADLLAAASTVVLVRRPADNQATARALLARGPGLRLVIEKPTGPDPASALALHEALDGAGVAYRTPYLFLHADWSRWLAQARKLAIVWRFPRRNAGDSWKYDDRAGGGALAYYFIHFLAVAAALGDDVAVESFTHYVEGGVEVLDLRAGTAERALRARFELGDVAPYFEIHADGASVFVDESPFGPSPRRGEADPRIPILQAFYRAEVISGSEGAAALHVPVLRLWTALDDRIRQERD